MQRESYLLSAYRPPTSYPVSLSDDEAKSWLHGYLCLWHPVALRDLSRLPDCASPYDHDTPQEGFLYVVPTGPYVQMSADWPDRLAIAQAVSFSATEDWTQTQTNFHACFAPDESAAPWLNLPESTVRLFRAVGLGYLLVEGLYDAMDHEHLLDAEGFRADIHHALQAAIEGRDEAAIREPLKLAVEKLVAARVSLTSNSLRWIDLVFPHPDKLGTPWPASLHQGLPLTVIASGELLEQLAESAPERFAELRAKILPDLPSTVSIASGAQVEREDALLPAESQWWNFRTARKTVRQHLGTSTDVYARLRSAYHPMLPSWLKTAGYQNAMMVSFDGALVPSRNASVLNWSAPDGKDMLTFGREAVDVADPLTFFNLVYSLYQAFTQDSFPVIAFKHNGDAPAPGYSELLTLNELGEVFGDWVGLAPFLAEQDYGDYLGDTSADDYFADYLDDRVTKLHHPNVVSGFAGHIRRRRQLDSAFTLEALHRMLTPANAETPALNDTLLTLENTVEKLGASQASPEVEEQIQQAENQVAELLAARIQARSPENQPGYMIFNSCNFPRRVALEFADFPGTVPITDPIKAGEFTGTSAKLVVEVPSLGFAWIPQGTGNAVTPTKPKIKTAEGSLVRNEYLEAEIDPETGALRVFRDLRTRVNRLGMQFVFNPGSKTKATNTQVTHAGPALGEVTCQGDIVDDHDRLLARFTQRIRAWMTRPALELSLTIEPEHKPTGYPWHSYYGARFAWRDERSALFRGVQGANMQSGYTRPCSPDYFEIRLGSERTFVFTGGLPFIQKHANRMADVVLIPEGETATQFDFLLAVDRDFPMQTATGWVTPSPMVKTNFGPPPTGPSAWLGHIDLPSLLLTSLRTAKPNDGANRAVTGYFLETSGYGGASDIRFARDVSRAFQIDGDGEVLHELAINESAIPVDFSANEMFRIQAEWL